MDATSAAAAVTIKALISTHRQVREIECDRITRLAITRLESSCTSVTGKRIDVLRINAVRMSACKIARNQIRANTLIETVQSALKALHCDPNLKSPKKAKARKTIDDLWKGQLISHLAKIRAYEKQIANRFIGLGVDLESIDSYTYVVAYNPASQKLEGLKGGKFLNLRHFVHSIAQKAAEQKTEETLEELEEEKAVIARGLKMAVEVDRVKKAAARKEVKIAKKEAKEKEKAVQKKLAHDDRVSRVLLERDRCFVRALSAGMHLNTLEMKRFIWLTKELKEIEDKIVPFADFSLVRGLMCHSLDREFSLFSKALKNKSTLEQCRVINRKVEEVIVLHQHSGGYENDIVAQLRMLYKVLVDIDFIVIPESFLSIKNCISMIKIIAAKRAEEMRQIDMIELAHQGLFLSVEQDQLVIN